MGKSKTFPKNTHLGNPAEVKAKDAFPIPPAAVESKRA
jgi:hypothetical protein